MASECPRCCSDVTWRNNAVRCLGCGREYCKECPDFRWGRFEVRCPDCGCREGRPLANSGEDPGRSRPSASRRLPYRSPFGTPPFSFEHGPPRAS